MSQNRRACANCSHPLPLDRAPQARYCGAEDCDKARARKRKHKERVYYFHDSPLLSGPWRREIPPGRATETTASELGKEPKHLTYQLGGKDDPLRLLEPGKYHDPARAEGVAEKAKEILLGKLLIAPGGRRHSIDSPERIERLIQGGVKIAREKVITMPISDGAARRRVKVVGVTEAMVMAAAA